MRKNSKNAYTPKKRNTGSRKRKKVLLIATEGKNKTEKLYFRNFNSDNVSVQFTHGNETDPPNMTARLICEYNDDELTTDDLAVCLVDTDFDSYKDAQIKEADNAIPDHLSEYARVIVSNPSIEIWFICHYSDSTRQYRNRDDVLAYLRQYHPQYEKSDPTIYSKIHHLQDVAIKNAKTLEKNCLEKGYKPHTVAFGPSTEIHHIIEWLNK